jgi:hypothetical protein
MSAFYAVLFIQFLFYNFPVHLCFVFTFFDSNAIQYILPPVATIPAQDKQALFAAYL